MADPETSFDILPFTRVRRSAYTFVRLVDESAIDVTSLLRGEIARSRVVGLRAVSPLADEAAHLPATDLELLLRLPAEEWTEVDELSSSGYSPAAVERLAVHGLLLTDSQEPALAGFLHREQLLQRIGWQPTAALFHSASQFPTGGSDEGGADGPSEVRLDDLRRDAEEKARSFIRRHGEPPPMVVERGRPGETIELPRPDQEAPALFDLLRRRRTCRTFARGPISLQDFSTLLYWVFACHGTFEISDEYRVQHKTSPSGGGTHPIEVYPVALGVDGVSPGIYHYRPMEHRLSTVRPFPEAEIRRWVVGVARGQTFVGEGGAVFLLTARFRRNFWKYPGAERTYSVIHQDLGHLSQTFYLVAAARELGAMYTAAISADMAAETLGVEPMEEGPLGLCVVGLPREDAETWLPIHPHEPADG